jgi:hypothetical protein
MIFSRKNAGKWVASKDGNVIATDKDLPVLMKKVSKRKDKDSIGYDLVPSELHFVGGYGIRIS